MHAVKWSAWKNGFALFVMIHFFGGVCYLMRIFSQGVAAAWLSHLLLEEEKVHGFGF